MHWMVESGKALGMVTRPILYLYTTIILTNSCTRAKDGWLEIDKEDNYFYTQCLPFTLG